MQRDFNVQHFTRVSWLRATAANSIGKYRFAIKTFLAWNKVRISV
jgi:hypothetical protein